jgi:hypothetical protein
MNKTIYAFTGMPAGRGYVPYVNLSEPVLGQGSQLTVRSEGDGAQGTITLADEQLRGLAVAILERLASRDAIDRFDRGFNAGQVPGNLASLGTADGVVPLTDDPHGQRGYIAADLRPTSVVLNEHWMAGAIVPIPVTADGKVIESNDFELPPACPLRNNGDDICEVCQ